MPRPGALLLDFGGVLADAPSDHPAATPERTEGFARQRAAPPELVLRLYNLVNGRLSPGRIQRSLTAGADAWARWRDEDWPDELSQAEVWERFVIADWPPFDQVPVRAAVKSLSYEWAWRNNWALRPGIPETLDAAAARHIPLAVVSNTLCGAAHRDFLAKTGVAHRFAVQIYSDEAGVRKPNPQMIWAATDQLGLSPRTCWFVGDSRRRDILCARRADIGRAILMRSPRTDREDPTCWPQPDETVEDGHALCDLLKSTD